jgi:ABC-type siderophore export system fused ATPase/permease subunit
MTQYGLVVQILLIAAGVIILIVDVALLAKRKLSEPISVTWGFAAIIFILAGIFLRPNGWINYISPAGLIMLSILVVLALIGLFLASSRMSELIRKNTEMAMNISLLNQEIVELKKDIAENHRRIEEKLK